MRLRLLRVALCIATLVTITSPAHGEEERADATEEPAEVAPAPAESAVRPMGCDFPDVATARTRYQRAYDRKAFAEARDSLQPILERCGKTLDPIHAYRIRNELAVTLVQLRDPMGCLETLAPVIPLARQRNADILEANPRFEGEELVRIAESTRATLRLCAGRAR